MRTHCKSARRQRRRFVVESAGTVAHDRPTQPCGVRGRMSGRKSLPLVFAASCGVLIAARVALAQTPLPLPPQIAAPQDVPFPGTIHLAVDATDETPPSFR